LPALIQRFFTDRLCVQIEASRHTVAGYRDADSDDAGRAFRLMSATCSDRSRPAVPIEVGRGGGSPAGLM
jgi:hypothetical protein